MACVVVGFLSLVGLVVPAPKAGASLTGGPDVIPAPPSVLDSSAANPPGATNNHQQAFDERQGVLLKAALPVDNGSIPAGTVVDSHMIFLNVPDGTAGASDLNKTWTFRQPVIGVMSDSNGTLEVQSSGILGAPGTAYPQAPFAARALEIPAGAKDRGAGGVTRDGYTIKGNAITVGMQVSQPGDWIRVITKATPPPSADLSVVKSASPSAVMILGQLSYTLAVRNAGPDKATAVTLTDALPAEVQVVSSSSERRACTVSGKTVTCDLGALDPGTSVSATIVVSAPLLPGTLTNTASAKGAEADPDSSNNSSSATTQVSLLPVPPAPPGPTPSPTLSPTPSPSPSVLGEQIPRPGELPRTGPALPLGLLALLGSCLIGIGTALVVRRRARSAQSLH
jgi:uncharacterized repeat protein (TIGR01451 family)